MHDWEPYVWLHHSVHCKSIQNSLLACDMLHTTHASGSLCLPMNSCTPCMHHNYMLACDRTYIAHASGSVQLPVPQLAEAMTTFFRSFFLYPPCSACLLVCSFALLTAVSLCLLSVISCFTLYFFHLFFSEASCSSIV